MKIALLQILPGNTLADQQRIGFSACEKAKSLGADIALFPEMWSSGYNINGQAIPWDSEFIQSFGSLAQRLDMAICVTYLEKHPCGRRNSAVLFDRHGALKFNYAKVHTCDFEEERHLVPGDRFYVADLDTPSGTIKTGCMICYDREFPESARILMLKGAELILVPNACTMEINRLAQLRTRAFENMVGIATCNYPEGKNNGHSTVFDGIGQWPGDAAWRDCCLLETGGEEGIHIADIDLDVLRDYRAREIHGNAYRRPDRYQRLVEPIYQEPFVRDDYRWKKSDD